MLDLDGSSTSIIEHPMSRLPDQDGELDGDPRDESRGGEHRSGEPCFDEPDSRQMSPSELFELVFGQLRSIASAQMRAQGADHTLQTNGLLNEVYLRVVRSNAQFNGRGHFLKVASAAMRQILVDHARRRNASKRPPPARRVVLDDYVDEIEERALDLLALDAALTKLEAAYPDLARLVEMHMFGGQTMRACAEAFGVTERTAFRRWETARTFLFSAIRSEDGEGED